MFIETSEKGAWESPTAARVSEGERTSEVTCPSAGSRERLTALFHRLGGL